MQNMKIVKLVFQTASVYKKKFDDRFVIYFLIYAQYDTANPE